MILEFFRLCLPNIKSFNEHSSLFKMFYECTKNYFLSDQKKLFTTFWEILIFKDDLDHMRASE